MLVESRASTGHERQPAGFMASRAASSEDIGGGSWGAGSHCLSPRASRAKHEGVSRACVARRILGGGRANRWPCGLMDKALVFGTKDCRFESCQGQPLAACDQKGGLPGAGARRTELGNGKEKNLNSRSAWGKHTHLTPSRVKACVGVLGRRGSAATGSTCP